MPYGSACGRADEGIGPYALWGSAYERRGRVTPPYEGDGGSGGAGTETEKRQNTGAQCVGTGGPGAHRDKRVRIPPLLPCGAKQPRDASFLQ